MTQPLLRVEGLSKHFPVTKGVFSRVSGWVRAVDDVSFELHRGETMGLVGESGCGKSTVGRTLLHLYTPTSGNVYFEGRNLAALSPDEMQRTRRNMQIVFQDPYSSLNPRQRVYDIVGEALAVHGIAKGEALRRRVFELLSRVGVSARWADRYAHEFSGGQRQRIGIARAIALEPKLLVCDEAVSALDVSIQAQIINLLVELRQELGLSYVFISHDLSVVRHISHRVLVMYLGQAVELGATEELFEKPVHPYTRALLSAVPVPDPRRQPARVILHGDVPSPLNPPSGCRFHTRCPVVFDRCSQQAPALYVVGQGRTARCFHAEGLEGRDDWYETLLARFDQVGRTNEHGAELSLRAAREAAPVAAPDVERGGGAGSTGGGALDYPPASDAALARGDAAARAASSPDDAAADLEWTERRRARAGAASITDAPKERVGSVWKRGMLVLTIGVLVISTCIATLRAVGDNSRVRKQLRGLHAEVRGYRLTTGRYPSSLSELGYRLGFVFGRERSTDPWGNPYDYVLRDELGRVEISSRGRDGAAGTADDVVLSEPWVTEESAP